MVTERVRRIDFLCSLHLLSSIPLRLPLDMSGKDPLNVFYTSNPYVVSWILSLPDRGIGSLISDPNTLSIKVYQDIRLLRV